MIEKQEIKLLPMVACGIAGGVWKYFIARPVAEAVQGWIDGHNMTQEELDQYIGEQAVSFIRPTSE